MKAFSVVPFATLALVAINIAAAFAIVLRPSIPLELGFRAEDPKLRDAFASLFLHQNVLHLLSNMVFLSAVGATVEQLSGTLRFIFVYFLSGLAGVAAHMVLGPSEVPLIGASGAVAGCAAYYCSRYLQLKVPVAPKVGSTVAGITAVWLALQIGGAFIHIGEHRAAVSYWAHIGGVAAGLLLSVSFRAPDLAHLRARDQALRSAGSRSAGARAAVAEQILRKNPRDVPALRDLADSFAEMGDVAHEAQVRMKLVEVLPEGEQAPELARLCELRQASAIPAIRRTLLADRYKQSHPEAAEALLMSVLAEPMEEAQRPEAMLALASLKLKAEPDRAAALLKELERTYPLHPTVEVARARGWLN